MNPVIWLHLHPETWPPFERYQYSTRRSIVSVTLDLHLHNTVGFNAYGLAKVTARIPLKGAYEYTADAFGTVGEPVAFFSTSIEERKTGTRQTWSSQKSSLIQYRKITDGAGSLEKTLDCSPLSFTQVLSPVFLLPALSKSWRNFDADYAGFYVSNRRIAAIMFSPISDSKDGDHVTLDIRNLELPSDRLPHDQAQWRALPWNQATKLRGEFDQKRQRLSSVEFAFPFMGRLRLQLDRYSTDLPERPAK